MFLILFFMLFPVAVANAAVTVSVNGSNHTIPQTNEKGWGTNVTAWIQAISQFTLQPNGGTFTLTGEVNTGATYGFKVPYIKTATAAPSTVGVLRLANTDSVGFRNAVDDGNLLLAVNSSNALTFNGAPISTTSLASFQDSTFDIYDNGDPTKKIAFQASGISTATTRTITMPDAAVDLGILTDATNLNTSGAIVRRDSSGDFVANIITAALSGNASTATALASNPSDCSSNNYATAIDASGNLTCGQVSATAGIAGTLPVSSGGTGLGALASNQLIIGLGSTSMGQVAVGTTSGQILTWNGTTYVNGRVHTTWGSATVTGSWTTNTTYTAVSRRDGPNLLLNFYITLGGAPDNVDLTITVPGSLSINTSGLATTTANRAILGECRATDSGTASTVGHLYYASSTTMSIWAANGTTSSISPVNQTGPWVWANNDSIYCSASIPIVGW